MTLILARDRRGHVVRVSNPLTSTPEAYAQCVEGRCEDCPISQGRTPTRGRCDCACHAFVPPV